MTEKKYILPIGSVVRLKKGDVLLMIVGRAQLFNEQGQIGYFDYSATLYPQGIDGGQEFVFFNREDIEEVLFKGFRNEQEKKFADSYDDNIKKITYPKLSING